MTSTLKLGAAAVLLALPLLGACGAQTPDATVAPTEDPTPTESPSEDPSPSPDPAPACTEIAPDAAALENIQAIVQTANTEPLLGHVASTVNVVLAASSAYGPQTPDEAALDLADFLMTDHSNPPAQYDFALPAATLDAYRAGDYAQYFPATALVGRGTDNRVVAFSFDCDGMIDTMLLVSDESLLL